MTSPAELVLAALNEALRQAASGPAATVTVTHTVTATMTGWTAERFWTSPDPVRLAPEDLATAFGCSPRTIYRLVAERGMPARRRDGLLLFIAGDVRQWCEDREEIVNRFKPKG